MSTKAIKAAVELLRSQSQPGSVAHDLAALALAEIAALRKAAKVIDEEGFEVPPSDLRSTYPAVEALALMEVIAAES
jgi:hypothetical protein